MASQSEVGHVGLQHKMVNFCTVVVCGNRGRGAIETFFCLPSVITHQEEQTRKLSKKQQVG